MDLGGDVTGNGVSKVFFTIVAAFAEFERDRIAERISDVKANERAKGRYLGGARPFGYTVDSDGNLISDDNEQSLIDRVVTLREKGKSLRTIAESVSSELTKVSHMTVKRILKDKDVYC